MITFCLNWLILLNSTESILSPVRAILTNGSKNYLNSMMTQMLDNGSFFSVEVKSYKIKCKRKRMKNAKGKNCLTTSYVSKDISRLWIGIVFSHFFNAQFYIIRTYSLVFRIFPRTPNEMVWFRFFHLWFTSGMYLLRKIVSPVFFWRQQMFEFIKKITTWNM